MFNKHINVEPKPKQVHRDSGINVMYVCRMRLLEKANITNFFLRQIWLFGDRTHSPGIESLTP